MISEKVREELKKLGYEVDRIDYPKMGEFILLATMHKIAKAESWDLDLIRVILKPIPKPYIECDFPEWLNKSYNVIVQNPDGKLYSKAFARDNHPLLGRHGWSGWGLGGQWEELPKGVAEFLPQGDGKSYWRKKGT